MSTENVLGALLSKLDDNALQAISRKANATPQQAQGALASAIPVLMNALAKNSSTPEGADALQRAVAKDHDGSLLDNLGSFLDNPAMANGSGILKHVLGDKQKSVAQYVSKNSGVSGSSASSILEIAAPLVMGYLGKNSSGGSGGMIGDLLNSFVQTEEKAGGKSQSMINQLLDRDKDGQVADDIAEMGMSFLGRILKKKR
ncbi:MAG: DUF937 domain-containing protein [Bacteroidales bacterium]|nr:DUF937 domain-containing protein [Bacteroidales bacterium]